MVSPKRIGTDSAWAHLGPKMNYLNSTALLWQSIAFPEIAFSDLITIDNLVNLLVTHSQTSDQFNLPRQSVPTFTHLFPADSSRTAPSKRSAHYLYWPLDFWGLG